MEKKDFIRKVRTDNGLSRRQFAEKLGNSHRTVEHWELGKRNPTEPTVKLIKILFKVEE